MIFQPHLYSRTNDLANEFAKSLDMADEVILLPIYPARELPMPGVTSELLLSKMNSGNKKVMTKPELLEWLQHNKRDFIITAGAGDIDTMVKPISEILINQ